MGYTTTSGRWADTLDVTLRQSDALTATANGSAVELGDRGTLRLTLDVPAASFVDTNEVQTITVDATGGTFTVTFNGQTTAALAFDVSAAAMQAALEGLSSVGAGNVTVTEEAGVYTVTFVGDLAGANQPAMTTDAGSLTGGAGTAAVATVTAGDVGNGTLDVTVQHGPDGSTWATLGTFTQATGVTSERKLFGPVDRYVRAVFTVAGDTPSFTVGLSGEAI